MDGQILSKVDAADIKAALLDAARISAMEPEALALSLIAAFRAIESAGQPQAPATGSVA